MRTVTGLVALLALGLLAALVGAEGGPIAPLAGAVSVPAQQTRTYLPSGLRDADILSTATPTTGATATPTTRAATSTATQTSGGATSTPTSTGVALVSAWRINNSNTSSIFSAKTDVQGVTVTAVAGTPEVKMVSNGIPSYSQTMSSSVLATLTARPNASTDFPSGVKVGAGTAVAWGQDIGYSSTSCKTPTPGAGYWPPGPVCPSSRSSTSQVYFPLTPVPATTPTTTSTGAVGYLVNGVSLYNWSDAISYNNDATWYRTAADWEKYDMDVDYGHAANGDYHHHFYPATLAAQLGDTGSGHSPIYGFAADGYPIYGPWYASGQLAVSGWQKRDYSASSATGCGVANKRICLMVDQTDKSKGTTALASSKYGPDTTASVNATDGIPVSTVSGVFAQDYYYDASACTAGAACLDQYNGHSHDGLGYHYHLTVTKNPDGSFTPAFPYSVGMSFYGSLPSNTFVHSAARQGMWAP